MVLQIKLVVVVVEFETSTSPKAPPPYPWAFELFKARLIKFSFSPPQRPTLGIPLSPARFLFLSPQLHYDTERPLRRKGKFSLYITA